MRLRYLTEDSVNRIRHNIRNCLDWYYAPINEYEEMDTNDIRTARTISVGNLNDVALDQEGPGADAANAIKVYHALRNLKPPDAADERLWVYITHRIWPRYSSSRWLKSRPDDSGKAIRQIETRFFAKSNRVLVSRNAASRLWWLGKIAYDVDRNDPRRFLDLILQKQELGMTLIERPFLSYNRKVLKCIYEIMATHWEASGPQAQLLHREIFRQWMNSLNRLGGIVLLDALSDSQLRAVLHQEASAAIRLFSDQGTPKSK